MHNKISRRKYTILIRWAAFGKRVESRPTGDLSVLFEYNENEFIIQ